MADIPDSFDGRIFVDRSLKGTRFISCDLSGVIARGCEVEGIEIDSPWLMTPGNTLFINGVDVIPFVDAELDRRFPGRELRRAQDPEGLRAAWAALETAWSATIARARDLPSTALDENVESEWSFSQTLRHLVFATDMWLGRAILGREDIHPLGLAPVDGLQVDEGPHASFEDVLAARHDRQARVRDYLDTVTERQLAELRLNPHGTDTWKPVRSCLHTILEEEWEHHRYAVRDLAALTDRR